MESGPPLNLSTAVKVENSGIHAYSEGERELQTIKRELIHQTDGDQSYLLLQPLANNENEVLAITGECVKEITPAENKNSKETDFDEQETGDSNKAYKCSHCSERFFRATQLRIHEKSHIEEKVHACEQCPETFPRLSLLLRHKQEHTKKVYECPECDIPLSTYNGFRMHMKKHKGEKRFRCTDCPMTFVQHSHLITHKRKHTGEKPYTCHICSNRFKQVSHLTTHLRTHTKDKPYICEYCNAAFSQTGSLKRHRRSHTGEKPYHCKKCDTYFVEKRNLNRHLLSHSGIRPFKCDLCSASFTQFIDLKRHNFSHSGFKPYKCDVCEAAFSRKNNLKWHKLTHEGDTPHICDICNVGFRIGRDLKNHKKIHVESKPYSCIQCKASFLQMSTLKRHINVHAGNKPYSCGMCSATFVEKSALKRHVQRHEAVKPFSCEVCFSSFLDARSLKRHKIVVHNNGHYEENKAANSPIDNTCQQCLMSFVDSKSLKRHLETVHNEVQVQFESNEAKAGAPSLSYTCHLCLSTFLNARALKRHSIVAHCNDQFDNKSKNDSQKQLSLKETSLTHEEENSLHIYEPSYQKNGHIPEPSMIVPSTVPDIPRNHLELSSQSICQVVSETNVENGTQVPTLVLSQPGQPPKTARPADSCQNHHSHVHTLLEGSYGQWQTWCFCDSPNIPTDDPLRLPLSDSRSVDIQNESNHLPIAVHQQLNFQEIPQSISNPLESLPASITQAEESHQHSLPNEHENQNKSHTNNRNVFQNINPSHSDEFHPANTSYSQYNNSLDYNGEIKTSLQCGRQDTNSIGVSLQAIDNRSLSSREIFLTVGKTFISVPASSTIESSAYHYSQQNLKKTQEGGSIGNDSMPRGNQGSLNQTQCVSQHVASAFEQHEVFITEAPQGSLKAPSSVKPENQGNSEEFTTDHIVSIDQDGYFKEQTLLKHPTYNYASKNLKTTGEIQDAVLEYKKEGKREEMSPTSVVTEPQTVILNNLQNQKYINNIPSYQLSVCDSLPQVIPNDLKKESVTLQYSLTVNNPATGDIQIQSEMFPAKTDEGPQKKPIKKRRVSKPVDEKEKQHICKVCSRTFQLKTQLDIHMRKHSGEKPFICRVCNQSFGHGNSLTIHMRSHTGERPFSCVYCGATFTQKSNLGVHHRIHTGEKPFKCDVCETAFSQGSHLIAHKRIHNNDRPFVCSTCGQAFTQRSALKRHEMKHSGLKPHACMSCESKFSQKEDLKRHIATHSSGTLKDKEAGAKNYSKGNYKRGGEKADKKRLSRKEDEMQIFEAGNHERKSIEEENMPTEASLSKTHLRGSNKIKTQSKKTPRKDGSFVKFPKTKVKDLPEPVRMSKRIKEAAEKRKFKPKNTDFITGDLDEIDRVEEMEEQLIKASRGGGNRKKENQKLGSEGVVQSWCFCEVPHGPNEPHTHTETYSKFNQEFSTQVSSAHIQTEINSNALITSDSCKEGVLQFTLPQLSHAVVLQGGEQVSLHTSQPVSVNSGTHLTLNSDSIVMNASVIPESQVLTSSISETNSIGGQFLTTSDQVSTSQDAHGSHVLHDDGKMIYGTAQIISGQVLPSSHFVTSEGAFYIEAGDIINSGTVVLNSSPGTFFFDLGSEGQLLNVPISANVSHDSVIVSGTSSIEGSASNQNEIGNSANTVPSSSAISFSVRDSTASTLLRHVSHGTSVLTSSVIDSQNIITSGYSNISTETEEPEGTSSSGSQSATVQYSHIEGNEIGLFNTNIALQTPGENSSPVVVSETFKDSENKLSLVNQSTTKCSVCSKEFAIKKDLKLHMLFAHPGLFVCSVCYDAFTTKEHLIIHKLQHKVTHSCPECLVTFANKSTLNQHRQREHKVNIASAKKLTRNFSCNRCKASFFQLSDLNRHLLGHTGVKPYKCKHCGACFTRKSSLNKHERIHTGEKPYACKECGVSFAYRYQFNRHTSEHPENEQTYSMPYVLGS